MLICRQLSFLSLCLVCLSPIILAFFLATNLLQFKIIAPKKKIRFEVKTMWVKWTKQVMEKDRGDFNSVARGHDFYGVTEVFHTKKEFSMMVLSAICSPSIILLILWLNHKHLQSG